ncbi:MAG: tRNA uridine-5-carboxymethylaminomethyl(34) synthesis enzyme MnmG, partial [Gammaproteobacteria bacterium]
DLRLTPRGRELGVVDDARWRIFETRREAVEKEQRRLRATRLHPDKFPQEYAGRVLGQALTHEYTLMDLLRRPDVTYGALMTVPGAGDAVADEKVAEQVEIQAKYHGYIERQQDEIERNRRHEETSLPLDFDYGNVRGLSKEAQLKLNAHKPATLGQAGRISGVTPAAISLLLVHLHKRRA